jgi:hypothetical protein
VAANRSTTQISVLLGLVGGGFGAPSAFTVGSDPISVALGDVNGDGKLDVAVANFAGGTVSVLLGNGAGGFGPKTDYPAGATPRSVAFADVDMDSKLDIVVTEPTANVVSVLSGNGAGAFSPRVNFGTSSGPAMFAVADLNADGRPGPRGAGRRGRLAVGVPQQPRAHRRAEPRDLDLPDAGALRAGRLVLLRPDRARPREQPGSRRDRDRRLRPLRRVVLADATPRHRHQPRREHREHGHEPTRARALLPQRHQLGPCSTNISANGVLLCGGVRSRSACRTPCARRGRGSWSHRPARRCATGTRWRRSRTTIRS